MHQQIALEPDEVAYCSYCNAVLARWHTSEVNHVLAMTIGAAIFFVIVSVTPVLTIELGATRTETNVWAAALDMAKGLIFWAALPLGLATFLVPMLQITLLLWVLSFASVARRAPACRVALVLLHWLAARCG